MAGRYNGTGQRAGVEREGRAIIVAYAQGLLRRRIVRYALVGGIGIPVNLLALALFLHLMGDRLYPLASACAFEVSTTVNFVLNQLYTYGEQRHLRRWEWPRRALKAQMASLSALAMAWAMALALAHPTHSWLLAEAAVAGGIGGLLPDLDEPGSTISNSPRILGGMARRLLRRATRHTPLRLLGALAGLLVGIVATVLNAVSRTLSWLVRLIAGGHREGSHWLPVWAVLSAVAYAVT